MSVGWFYWPDLCWLAGLAHQRAHSRGMGRWPHPGAVLVQVQGLTSFAGEWHAGTDAKIAVHCAKGTRGNFAATILRTAGCTNVRNLMGGFGGWAQAELPVDMP